MPVSHVVLVHGYSVRGTDRNCIRVRDLNRNTDKT